MFIFLVFSACCRTPECMLERFGTGGGQDVVSANLPFDASFIATCTQGAGGSYSHSYDSTQYDVDLDTPNDEDIPVYAPIDGVAYVHDTDRNRNFGVHVNIDIGDGTYIVIAHMDDVFVDNGSEVAAGQMIGFEGTTGASTGDHVHIGRHDGDPAQDAVYGDSIEGLSLFAGDSSGDEVDILTSSMDCAMSGGGRYTSLLATPRWRPSGSLVMTPFASTVYELDGFTLRPFTTESAFVSRGLDFTDVALVSEEEAACYTIGESIMSDSPVLATYDEEGVWLLVGSVTDSARYRIKVPTRGWQGVVKTWGISAATYDDLVNDDVLGNIVAQYPRVSGSANYRDGALVSPIENATVFVMSDGAALPIDRWETLLLLGWEDRDVVEVDEDEFESVATLRGSCTIDSYCLAAEDVVTCGGPHESGEGVYPAETTGDTGSSEEETASPDADPNDLELLWQTPNAVRADRISLSGELTDENGYSYGWNQNIATVSDTDLISFSLPARSGDSFRYSIEYVVGGVRSWSCLAPYPPGTSVGTSVANWDGTPISVAVAGDPSSDGCGLQVIVPD
ncbi:MAG: M23 family metallopeptidase [Candidatus Uhrbacteria bacterium]|nr:M23 family metallopeptidase [Candidatus Uhrbacteria bacterium]